MKVDFATFCYKGDAPRLHFPGQLKKQVESNDYNFNQVIVIHQLCSPRDYRNSLFEDCNFPLNVYVINDLDEVLKIFDINIDKPQYVSDVDKAHTWKNHVVNHLAAVMRSDSDYIVFADADCWIVHQPDSWVNQAIRILSSYPDVFIVSPNDGEPERRTQVISQQMFMTRTHEFKYADFNQPGWDGNTDFPGAPMPEYWGMLEGRIGTYCKYMNKYRYVLGPEYRYWHFNRINPETNMFETNMEKYR